MISRQHLRSAAFSQALLWVAMAVAVLGLSPTALAQTTITKNTTGTDLNAQATWTGLTGSPTAADVGLFNSTWTASTTLTFSSTLTIGEIQVTNPTSAITIQPGSAQTLNLGNAAFTNQGGIDMSGASVGLTFGTNVGLVLTGGTQVFDVGNSTSHPGLTISGTINTNNGGINITGNGPVTLGGVVSGSGGILTNSANTTTLSGTNTLSGGVNVGNGTLNINNASALGTGTFGIGTYWTDANTQSIDTPAGSLTLTTNNLIQLDNSFTFVGTGNLNLGTGATTLGDNITITTTANTLTLGGVIDDGGTANTTGRGITKAGAGGTLVLANANTFTGNLNLTAGTLTLGSNLALQDAVLNATGGTLTITPSNATIGGLAGTQTLSLGTAAVTLNTSSIQYPNVTYSGALTGTTATLTKTGTGSQTLSGNNSYTGLTTVSGGTLILSGNNTAATGGVTVASGGTLAINNATALGTGTLSMNGGTIDNTSGATIANTVNNNVQLWNADFTFTGTGNLNLGTGAVTMNASRTVTVSASTLTVGGVIGGAFSLTKNGTGTLVLSNTASTYSGATTINGGTLSVSTLANSATNSGIGASTSAAANLIINGGTLQYTGATVNTNRLFTVGPNGATIDSSPATISNTLTLSNAGSIAFSSSTAPANLTLTGTGTGVNTLTSILGDSGSGVNLTSLNKTGTGEWLVNGLNTYTGVTTISGGTLQVTTVAVGGTASGIGKATSAASNLIINGGTLQFATAAGSAQTTDHLFTIGTSGATIDASGTTAARTLTLSNAGSIAFSSSTAPANLTLTGTNTGANTLTSILGDASAGNATSLIKNGVGKWVLGGANTYTGGTTLNLGTLQISAAAGFGNGPLTINGGSIDAASALTASNNIAQNWNSSFTFVGTNTLNMGTGAVTLGANDTVTVSASTLTIGGVIDDGANTFSLSKAGAGTLVLNGANTYSGNTNVSVGTLTLGSTSSIQNSILNFTGGTVNVATGANKMAGLAGTANIAIGTNTLSITTAAGVTSSYSGSLTGTTGGVTIAGAGTQAFSGFGDTYTGNTTLNSGTLAIDNAGNATNGPIGAAAANLTINGGNLNNTTGAAITLLTNNPQKWNGDFGFTGTQSLGLGTGAVAMNASRIVTISANTLTVGGIISGAGFGLEKQGNGTLSLFGANSYTGATTVSAGTLKLDFSLNALTANIVSNTSVLTMNGGTLNVTGRSGTTDSQTFASTTINSGASSIVQTLNTATGLTTALGAVTRAAGGTLNVTVPASTTISATVTTTSGVITSGGTAYVTFGGTDWANISTGTMVAATSTNQLNASSWSTATTNYAVNAAMTGNIAGDTTINSLKVSGSAAENINLQNHILTLTTGGIVISGSSTPTFSNGTLKGSNTGELVIVQNSSGTAVISANILNNTGATGLTKSGTGALTLSGANAYTGNTTMNQGTLNINGNTALGAAASIFIINGGTLDNTSGSDVALTNNNAQKWNQDFTFTGTGNLNLGTGAVTLGSNRTVAVNGSTLTVGGVISGASFSLTKAGTGNLVLGGASTYGGGTNINSGLVEVTNNNALGANATTTTVASGATLQIDNGVSIGGNNQATGVISGSLLNIAGTGVGGVGALVSSGTGTGQWYGNVALTANATISSGSSASGQLTIGDGTADSAYNSNISLGSNTLTLAGTNNTGVLWINSNITGTGGVTVNTAGTVHYFMNNNSYTGTTAINNGTLILDTYSETVPTLPGAGNLGITGNLVIGDGTGSGNTAILQMGTATGGARNLIASNSNVTINPDGKFFLNGQTQTIQDLTINAGYINSTSNNGTGFGLLTVNGNTTIQANTNTAFIDGNFGLGNSVGLAVNNITVAAGGNATSDLTVNALVSGGGFVKNGAGTMVLSNPNNTFTNTVEVAGGTLTLTAGGNVLGATGNGTTVDSGAQLQMKPTSDISVAAETLTLNGNGTANNGALQNVQGNNTWTGTVLTGANNANINNSGGNLTISGNIGVVSGTPTLTFTGVNTTTLSGNVNGAQNLVVNAASTNKVVMSGSLANTYTGNTTVNSGATLELNKTASTVAISGSTITVNSGGTLLSDTTEQIGAGTKMVLNGGTWTTNGAAAATWTENLGTLTLSANSTINLGSGNNTIGFQASNANSWTPGSTLTLNNWTGNLSGAGTDQIKFALSSGLGGTSYTGQLGDIIFVNPVADGTTYTGSYHAIILSTGEVVPFLPAPEPGTVAAGASLAILAGLREWRRRKNRMADAK